LHTAAMPHCATVVAVPQVKSQLLIFRVCKRILITASPTFGNFE
jgi:hypothetical protein